MPSGPHRSAETERDGRGRLRNFKTEPDEKFIQLADAVNVVRYKSREEMIAAAKREHEGRMKLVARILGEDEGDEAMGGEGNRCEKSGE